MREENFEFVSSPLVNHSWSKKCRTKQPTNGKCRHSSFLSRCGNGTRGCLLLTFQTLKPFKIHKYSESIWRIIDRCYWHRTLRSSERNYKICDHRPSAYPTPWNISILNVNNFIHRATICYHFGEQRISRTRVFSNWVMLWTYNLILWKPCSGMVLFVSCVTVNYFELTKNVQGQLKTRH